MRCIVWLCGGGARSTGAESWRREAGGQKHVDECGDSMIRSSFAFLSKLVFHSLVFCSFAVSQFRCS